MDNESDDLETTFQGSNVDYNANASYVFLPIWLRSIIQINNELDRFLLDYGFNILPYIGIFFYMLLLLF